MEKISSRGKFSKIHEKSASAGAGAGAGAGAITKKSRCVRKCVQNCF